MGDGGAVLHFLPIPISNINFISNIEHKIWRYMKYNIFKIDCHFENMSRCSSSLVKAIWEIDQFWGVGVEVHLISRWPANLRHFSQIDFQFINGNLRNRRTSDLVWEPEWETQTAYLSSRCWHTTHSSWCTRSKWQASLST